jgi:LysR family glycine cleavage system transcriptional activator
MPTPLPPLNALRALEAAGRRANFSRAAEELNVTPGAISRQIRNLEIILGVSLFTRNFREVKLTPEGEVYCQALTEAFAQIQRVTRRLVDSHKEHHLHIHCPVTFTLRWLVRRLVIYHAIFPRREVQMSTGFPAVGEMDYFPTDVTIEVSSEAAIRAAGPDLIGHPLVPVDLVPVCSPRLVAEGGLCTRPADWARVKLLKSSARPRDWDLWAERTGVAEVHDCDGIFFASSSMAYEAAIEGIGVAIGMRALVEEDLRDGRLVVAHPQVVQTGTAFYLMYSKSAARMRQVREFRDWILAEAAAAPAPRQPALVPG